MHGVGYDFILTRRLWKDLTFRADFNHYELDDYTVWADTDSEYFNDSPWGRRMRDLQNVSKDGVEVNVNGHVTDKLAFNLGYSYQIWDSDGTYAAAAEELSDRARHSGNLGFEYRILKNTLLMADYSYQGEQTAHIVKEDPPESGNQISYTNHMDSYNVFDFALEQIIFKDTGSIEEMTLKVYCNNAFDENYEEKQGLPMTDRTFGITLGCSL